MNNRGHRGGILRTLRRLPAGTPVSVRYDDSGFVPTIFQFLNGDTVSFAGGAFGGVRSIPAERIRGLRVEASAVADFAGEPAAFGMDGPSGGRGGGGGVAGGGGGAVGGGVAGGGRSSGGGVAAGGGGAVGGGVSGGRGGAVGRAPSGGGGGYPGPAAVGGGGMAARAGGGDRSRYLAGSASPGAPVGGRLADGPGRGEGRTAMGILERLSPGMPVVVWFDHSGFVETTFQFRTDDAAVFSGGALGGGLTYVRASDILAVKTPILP